MSNPLSLYGYCLALPDLQQRVFFDTAPAVPGTPYTIVYDVQGGLAAPYHGNSDALIVYPSVTAYHKPGAGETSTQARRDLMYLMAQLAQAVHTVNLHSDGVTPFLKGSFSRQTEFPPMPDKAVAGQYYGTLRFSAMYLRT